MVNSVGALKKDVALRPRTIGVSERIRPSEFGLAVEALEDSSIEAEDDELVG